MPDCIPDIISCTITSLRTAVGVEARWRWMEMVPMSPFYTCINSAQIVLIKVYFFQTWLWMSLPLTCYILDLLWRICTRNRARVNILEVSICFHTNYVFLFNIFTVFSIVSFVSVNILISVVITELSSLVQKLEHQALKLKIIPFLYQTEWTISSIEFNTH